MLPYAHLTFGPPQDGRRTVTLEVYYQHTGTDVEEKIRQILDLEIRPAVMQDGGDITLDRFENGVAYLHMRGSCSGCPSSTMTLKMGIENRLREVVPEVVEVVPV